MGGTHRRCWTALDGWIACVELAGDNGMRTGTVALAIFLTIKRPDRAITREQPCLPISEDSVPSVGMRGRLDGNQKAIIASQKTSWHDFICLSMQMGCRFTSTPRATEE